MLEHGISRRLGLAADYRCIGIAADDAAGEVIDLDRAGECTPCDRSYFRRLTRLVRTFAGAGPHDLAVAVDGGSRFVAVPPSWGARLYVARVTEAKAAAALPRLYAGHRPASFAGAAALVLPPTMSDACRLAALLRVHVIVDPCAVHLDCEPTGQITVRSVVQQ